MLIMIQTQILHLEEGNSGRTNKTAYTAIRKQPKLFSYFYYVILYYTSTYYLHKYNIFRETIRIHPATIKC